ncbi:MAG: 2-hydroxymuconate tautomerase family protein [Candidatus Bathyarchaeia archaeon]
MPIVHVYVWRGFSSEAKRKVISGVTKVFVELGIPAEAVEVLIHEVPKEDWGVGGEPASERLKHVQPP